MKPAASAVAAGGPVLWSLLGYQYEAASMLAGLFACVIVRIYMWANPKTRQGWLVDLTISALTVLFTAVVIGSQRPTPFFAVLTGTGLGALGSGIIKIAVSYVRKLDAFAEAEPDVDDDEGIRRAMERLHDTKGPGE